MKKPVFYIALLIAVCPLRHFAQTQQAANEQMQKALYYQAKQEIEQMLNGKKPLSYERAVFLMENAWWNGGINYDAFQQELNHGVKDIQLLAAQSTFKMQPSSEPKNFWAALNEKNIADQGYPAKLKLNNAIYRYMTDTNIFINKNSCCIHYPRHYATKDPMGSNDWTNTQVCNLLQNGVGNCFAFVSLFKVYAERLNSDVDICTAPGHVYITHKDEKGIQYNVEIASQAFPGTGTLSTLTHSTQKGIENDISLRQLDLKKSVALCLVYLAKGYEHKFKVNDPFLLDCAELALRHDSLNLNAMLLKAEILEGELIGSNKSIGQLQAEPLFKTYQKLITKLYKLGYREMPLDMKNLLVKGLMRDSITRLAMKNYEPKPIGKETALTSTRYASLSWGMFEEQIQDKPVERIGRTLYNTRKQRITGFTIEQDLYNHYDFDPVVFAWNVDPLAHKAPGVSPYAFCEDNPILYLDPDGRFKANYNDKILNENGLTRVDMVRFEAIMNNMSRLLEGNQQLVDAISNTTGRTPDQVRRDYSAGQGAGVTITAGQPQMGMSYGGQIHIEPAVIKNLAAIDPANKEALAKQVTGVALMLAHEDGHWGDQQRNGGNTGQFEVKNKFYPNGDPQSSTNEHYLKPTEFTGTPNFLSGAQYWKISPFGHRGDDVTILGFGVQIESGSDGAVNTIPVSSYPNTVRNSSLPLIPTTMPSNVSGTNSLTTFGVH